MLRGFGASRRSGTSQSTPRKANIDGGAGGAGLQLPSYDQACQHICLHIKHDKLSEASGCIGNGASQPDSSCPPPTNWNCLQWGRSNLDDPSFSCSFPTEQVLYYRNLGLYYGLASTTPPLHAKPRTKVKGGCLPCDSTQYNTEKA